MRNIIFLLLFTAALLLSFYFFRENNEARTSLQEAKTRLTEAETKLLQCNLLFDSLKLSPSQAESTPSAESRDHALKKLKAAGFTEPEEQLLQSLQNQPKLMPGKGVLGGTMAYRQVQVLTNNFALAYFEDGHNGGYAILRYSIKNPAEINWKLVDHHGL